MKEYVVYIVASRSLTLYIGVTNDIRRRVRQHKEKHTQGFTSRYNVDRLLYYETFTDIGEAIAREKQLKVWRRERKIALICSANPNLIDLSSGW